MVVIMRPVHTKRLHFTDTWEMSELSWLWSCVRYTPNVYISPTLENRASRHGRDHASGALQTPTFHRHLGIERTVMAVVMRPVHTKRLHFTDT